MPPPKVEPREMEGGSVEVLVSGLPQSKEEDEIRSAVESHVGPVTLDLQRAEVAHMQTVRVPGGARRSPHDAAAAASDRLSLVAD
jgi:hypothetical protein